MNKIVPAELFDFHPQTFSFPGNSLTHKWPLCYSIEKLQTLDSSFLNTTPGVHEEFCQAVLVKSILSMSATTTQVQASIISCLDYGSSLITALPVFTLALLCVVFHTTATVIFLKCKLDDVTSFPKTFHQLLTALRRNACSSLLWTPRPYVF